MCFFSEQLWDEQSYKPVHVRVWYKQILAPNFIDSQLSLLLGGWLSFGESHAGIAGSKDWARNWKDLRICPKVNVIYIWNTSQIVQSPGSLPLNFLRPVYKGHGLSIVKVTACNKQLLMAEEGVTVFTVTVGNSLFLLIYGFLLSIQPRHPVPGIAVKAMLKESPLSPEPHLNCKRAFLPSARKSWPWAECVGEAERLGATRTRTPRWVWAEALGQWRLKPAHIVWMNLYSTTECRPDAAIKAGTSPCGPGKAEDDLNMGQVKAQQYLEAASLWSPVIFLLAAKKNLQFWR